MHGEGRFRLQCAIQVDLYLIIAGKPLPVTGDPFSSNADVVVTPHHFWNVIRPPANFTLY
jgi:hypothetical protein